MTTVANFIYRISIIAVTVSFGRAYAQAPPLLPPDCEQMAADLSSATPDQVGLIIRIDNSFLCYAEELDRAASTRISRIRTDVVSHLQTAGHSSNRQVGAPSNAAGSTSAVSQPFDLLSLASEYGGITTSANNGTFTVKSALDQLPRTIAESSDHSCPPTDKNWPKCFSSGTLNFLHRFSVSATFNTSTASKTVNATPVGAAQGATQQIATTPRGSATPSFSAFTTKFTLINDKADGAGPWVKAVLADAKLGLSANAFLTAQDTLSKVTQTASHFNEWWQLTASSLQAALKARSGPNDPQLRDTIAYYFGQLYNVLVLNQGPQTMPTPYQVTYNTPLPADLASAMENVEKTLQAYQSKVDGLRTSITSPVLTFEYDYNTPQNQQTNSVFRLIISKNILRQQKNPTDGVAVSSSDTNAKGDTSLWTLTGNVAGSIYNSNPSGSIPGASRTRDIQAAVEADYTLPSFKPLGQTSLGGAYYFQYQSSPAILNVTPGQPISGITFVGLPSAATQVFTQAGNIHVAQLKWGLGTGKKLKFPLAFSYSNRTELITKPDWRGQFGISYDFTSLTNNTTTDGSTIR